MKKSRMLLLVAVLLLVALSVNGMDYQWFESTEYNCKFMVPTGASELSEDNYVAFLSPNEDLLMIVAGLHSADQVEPALQDLDELIEVYDVSFEDPIETTINGIPATLLDGAATLTEGDVPLYVFLGLLRIADNQLVLFVMYVEDSVYDSYHDVLVEIMKSFQRMY